MNQMINLNEVIVLLLVSLVFFVIVVYLSKKYMINFIKKQYLYLISQIEGKINSKINLKNIPEFRKKLKLVLFIVFIGLFINKLAEFVPLVGKILNFPIVSTKIIQITILSSINALLTYILVKKLVELSILLLNLSLQYSRNFQEELDNLNLDDILNYLGTLIAITISLVILGLNFALLLPVAGALGLGFGFALQDLLKNVISGLIIIFGRVIKKGDYVKFNDLEGYVKEINLRTTIIKTPNNEEIVIPNSIITDSPLINYSLSSPEIKVDLPFGVSYSSDVKKVFEIVKKVASKFSLKEPEIYFLGFGDSSLDFKARVWINIKKDTPLNVKTKFYSKLFEEFKKEGIEIPFPQLDVWFKNELKIKK